MTTESDILATADPDTGVEQTSAPEQTSAAPATDTAQETQTAQGDSPATPAAPNAPSPESLTSSPPVTQPTQPQTDWTKEGPVLQKRYDDIRADYNRKINQWQQTYQQQQGHLTELQKFKQEQEQRAKAADLKPWSKQHPENSKFSGLLERARTIERQLQSIDASLPPEQQAAARNAIVSALSPEERTQITDYRENLQTFQRDFFTDPQGTLMPMVERMAEQKLQQVMERQAAQQAVARDFEDPQLKPLIEKYRSDYTKALEDGVPYEYSTHMLRMHASNQDKEAEIAKLKAELAQAGVKVESADERQRLAKGEAAITRDPRQPVRDPYEMAKNEAHKKGISPSSPQFAALLAKHSR